MKRMIGFVMMAIAGTLLLGSCTKDPVNNLTEEESRIYITNRDNAANFNNYKTFSIVDSVSVIDNSRLSAKETTAWDKQIIAAVSSAMQSRGYTRVSRSQLPDLGINISRLYNTTTNVVSYNYWNDYSGYYDPYYWGYSGYGYYFPPTYGFYESTEAAASVDILDLKNASSNQTIKGVWSGLIRGSGIFNTGTIDSQVKVLFDQSPYLKSQP